MRNSPESPISLGEYFFIRDAEAPEPLTAAVVNTDWVETTEGIWQRVQLKRLGRSRTSFEMSTSRRINYGVYTNRNGRYTFLRLTLLPFEELLRYFDNGAREAAEEFIKSSTRYAIIDKML